HGRRRLLVSLSFQEPRAEAPRGLRAGGRSRVRRFPACGASSNEGGGRGLPRPVREGRGQGGANRGLPAPPDARDVTRNRLRVFRIRPEQHRPREGPASELPEEVIEHVRGGARFLHLRRNRCTAPLSPLYAFSRSQRERSVPSPSILKEP